MSKVKSVFFFIVLFTNLNGYTQLVPIDSLRDSSHFKPRVVANILLLGNNRTHDEVILRELTFTNGDTVLNLEKELQRSRSNLINTQLFNFVDVKKMVVDSVFTDIVVVLKERWYIWPFPVFKFAEPNFNTWWLNKDFSRTNYGVLLLWRNFRGWNEDLAIKAQFGYSKEFMALYRMPALTMKQRMGMQISANYTQQEEITVGTKDNKRIFFTSGTGRTRTELAGKLAFFYRGKLYITHSLEMRYQNLQVVDSVTKFTNDYFYKNEPHSEFPGFNYVFRFDKRDNKGYSLRGILVQAEIHKYGLSFVNYKNMNVAYVTGYCKNYFQLTYRWYAAIQNRFRYNLTEDIPYFLQQALGYENFVRGYEYYVIDGQHYALTKANIKYNLIRPKAIPVDFLKRTNFYMFHWAVYVNVFTDVGYVWDKYYSAANALANTPMMSIGAGIDVVTYYDKVVRFEYAYNGLGIHGFYVHFVQPI